MAQKKDKSWSEMAGRAAKERPLEQEHEKEERAVVWAEKEIHDAWQQQEGHALRDLLLARHAAFVQDLIMPHTHEESIQLRARIEECHFMLGVSAHSEAYVERAARQIVAWRRT